MFVAVSLTAIAALQTCPDTLLHDVGVSRNPFNQTQCADWACCCTFCHAQQATQCLAWTFHQGGTCYVADRVGPPGKVAGAVSGTPSPSPSPPPSPSFNFTEFDCGMRELEFDFATANLGRADPDVFEALQLGPARNSPFIQLVSTHW